MSAAIGIICKAPRPGASKTRLAAAIGAEAACELSACFLRDVAAWMPKNAILSAEGAGTMDIGLTQLPSFNARSCLNAGTYGTMGVGLGHAIAACVAEALRCKEIGEAKTLFFNLSGHGHFDMAAYDRYFAGDLTDYEYPAEAIDAALHHLPKVG